MLVDTHTHTFHTIYSEKKEPCAKSIKHGAHGAASIRGAPLPWACDEDTDGGYIGCVSDYELPSATTVLSIIILADTAQLLAPGSPCRAAAHMSPLTRNLDLIQ